MPNARSTPIHIALSPPLAGALLLVVSASIAALLAHVAIDVAGDYLLPHDPYDDIAHGSRTMISGVILAVLAAAAIRLLVSAFDDARGAARRRWKSAYTGRGAAVAFAALTAIVAIGLLAGMEALDCVLARQTDIDLPDLLGGSIWLGLGITIPIALTVALGARMIAAWAAAAGVAATRVISAWFLSRTRRSAAAKRVARWSLPHFAPIPVLARNASKRGPPHRLR